MYMKFSSLLIGAAFCAASASSFALGPKSEYNFTYLTKLELVNPSAAGGSEVVKVESIGTGGGQGGLSAHWEKVGKPEKVVNGNTTTLRSVIQTYGYQLIVTPDEPAPGEFEKTGHVQTSIQYDQILKGEGGVPLKHHAAKMASLGVGDSTTLEWTNNGSSYRLTVALAKSEALSKE
jgi:hypothetical protein